MLVFCNLSGITTCLPFRLTPRITVISSQNMLYGLRFCAMWSLFSGHPLKICSFSCCKWLSSDAAHCSSCIIMHSGMFIVVCMVLMCTCIPGISLSLFSLWFCLETQSAMKRSGPGLYIILTLYWLILRRIHYSLCDSVTTSFVNIVTSGLWSVISLPSLVRQ